LKGPLFFYASALGIPAMLLVIWLISRQDRIQAAART
jgi:hypothetical protein